MACPVGRAPGDSEGCPVGSHALAGRRLALNRPVTSRNLTTVRAGSYQAPVAVTGDWQPWCHRR